MPDTNKTFYNLRFTNVVFFEILLVLTCIDISMEKKVMFLLVHRLMRFMKFHLDLVQLRLKYNKYYIC